MTGRIAIAALPFNVRGITWSQTTPGELLVWNSSRIAASGDGGRTWGDRWSDPAIAESHDDHGFTACWSGRSVLLTTGNPGLAMRSTDGGTSFTRVSIPPATFGSRLRCRPGILLGNGTLVFTALSTITVAAPSEAVTSTDGGLNWARLEVPQDAIITPGPHQPTLWSLAARDPAETWRVSLDGGHAWKTTAATDLRHHVQWTHAGTQILLDASGNLVELDFASGAVTSRKVDLSRMDLPWALVRDPRDARRIYAADPEFGLRRSVDDGRTWQTFSRAANDGVTALDLTGARRPRLAAISCEHLISRQRLLIVDLAQPDDDLFRSTPTLPPGVLVRTAPPGGGIGDPHVACRPGTSELLLWGCAGIWRSRDVGATWEALDRTQRTFSGWNLAPGWDSVGTSLVMSIYHEQALIATPADASLHRLPLPEGCGQFLLPPVMRGDGSLVIGWRPAGAPAKDRTLRIATSRNGGKSWQDGRPITDLAFRLLSVDGLPVLLGYAQGDRIASTDLGQTLCRVPIHRSDSGPDFTAGGQLWTISVDGAQLFRFDVAAQRWTARPLSLPPLAEGRQRAVHGLVVDPRDPRRLWLTCKDAVIHSNDDGATWRQCFPDIRRTAFPPQLAWVSGDRPRLVITDDTGLILVDPDQAGEALFDRPYLPLR